MAQNRQQQSGSPIERQGRITSRDSCINAATGVEAASGRASPPAAYPALQEINNNIIRTRSPTSNSIQYHREGNGTTDSLAQSQSQAQLEEALWKAENAGLEDEFSALKTILGSYMELQTRIFHDLGGEEIKDDNNEISTTTSKRNSISTASAASRSCRKANVRDGSATNAAEVASAVATVEYDQRGLVLSDAVRYIHHLEILQDSLATEKSVLESKVSRWEQLRSKDVKRLDEGAVD